jgi:fatty acid desaturase
MPYHSAHHAVPTVPFHKLPELNAKLSSRLKSTAEGYVDAHRQIRAAFVSRQ